MTKPGTRHEQECLRAVASIRAMIEGLRNSRTWENADPYLVHFASALLQDGNSPFTWGSTDLVQLFDDMPEEERARAWRD